VGYSSFIVQYIESNEIDLSLKKMVDVCFDTIIKKPSQYDDDGLYLFIRILFIWSACFLKITKNYNQFSIFCCIYIIIW